jgi:hypothetical protein
MQKTVFRQSTEYLLDSQINKGFKAKIWFQNNRKNFFTENNQLNSSYAL